MKRTREAQMAQAVCCFPFYIQLKIEYIYGNIARNNGPLSAHNA